jgi:hypothetical protein
MQWQYSHTSGPPLTSIQWPHCPNCDQPMRLARIAPGGSAFDVRTFECAGCHHIDTATGRNRSDEIERASLARKPRLEAANLSEHPRREDAMEEYIHLENLKLFKRHLALAKGDAQRQLLLRLLAEEEARVPIRTR